MNTFTTKLLDGHVIVNMNKFDYIIDTGSPFSFGRRTAIVINGKTFTSSSSAMSGLTSDSISNLSGLQVDGLIGTAMGIPIIILNIGQEDRRIFFDTGAELSYLRKDLLVDDSIGQIKDFYPAIRTFTTNIYKIDVIIDKAVETMIFGLLPPSIRMLLAMGETEEIIGAQLLNKYTITLSDLTKNLMFEPFDQHHESNNEQIQQNLTLVRELSFD